MSILGPCQMVLDIQGPAKNMHIWKMSEFKEPIILTLSVYGINILKNITILLVQ